MTDTERAKAVVKNWLVAQGFAHITTGWPSRGGIESVKQRFVDELSAEFIVVRAEERSKIANFISEMGEFITGPELGRGRIKELEEAITDAMKVVGRQVVCDGACGDPYCILARALGRNLPVAP